MRRDQTKSILMILLWIYEKYNSRCDRMKQSNCRDARMDLEPSDEVAIGIQKRIPLLGKMADTIHEKGLWLLIAWLPLSWCLHWSGDVLRICICIDYSLDNWWLVREFKLYNTILDLSTNPKFIRRHPMLTVYKTCAKALVVFNIVL